MTANVVKSKKKNAAVLFKTLLCLTLTGIMIALGEQMKDAIYEGFVFSFKTVIPTLFPFFILSDLWSAVFTVDPSGRLSNAFQKLFGINGLGFSALFSGLICGFPVGVKIASQLYKENKITKGELERLSGFANNPSMAFVISGVGAGILGNVRLGFLLYISVVLSALIVGFIFRDNSNTCRFMTDNSGQSFDFVESVRSAGFSALYVCSCIVFFSGLLGLISAIIKNDVAISFIAPFLEVSNAVKIVSHSSNIPSEIKLALTAFALGFSGFSVHLQAFSFLPKEASRRKYLIMKLIQGVISSALMFIFLLF